MKLFFKLAFLFIPINCLSQLDSAKIVCTESYLPSPNYQKEIYSLDSKGAYHFYCLAPNQKFSFGNQIQSTPKFYPKGETVNKKNIYETLLFVKKNMEKKTLRIDINIEKKGIPNSRHRRIHINLFKLQKKLKYIKKSMSTDNEALLLLKKFGGGQIDGSWLNFEVILNNDTTMQFSIGKRMIPSTPQNIRLWLTCYQLFHKFKLFSKSKIQEYFSEKKLEDVVKIYEEIIDYPIRKIK